MENTLCLLLLKVPQWSNLHVTVAAGKVTHLFFPLGSSPQVKSQGTMWVTTSTPGTLASPQPSAPSPRSSSVGRSSLFGRVSPSRQVPAGSSRTARLVSLTLCSSWLPPISKQGPPLVSSLVPLGAGRGGQLPKANIWYSARETRSRVMECVQG